MISCHSHTFNLLLVHFQAVILVVRVIMMGQSLGMDV
jgi:hypothetical protein